MIRMTDPSWAGIITAFASLFIAIGGVITSITVLLPLLKSSRQVHRIVNQQRTDMLRYQRALIKALKVSGVDVPDDQSIEPPSEDIPEPQ